MRLFLLLRVQLRTLWSLPEADDQWGPDVAAVRFLNLLSVCGVELCPPKIYVVFLSPGTCEYDFLQKWDLRRCNQDEDIQMSPNPL